MNFFLFPAADRIEIAVFSWGTQGEGLVCGRTGHAAMESDPGSSYALAIQIKHFFHARNTVNVRTHSSLQITKLAHLLK